MLVATGQGNVYLIRERDHFWRSRPWLWLVTSSVTDLALVTLMATLSGLLIAKFLVIVAVYLVILDQLKVLIFRRFKIH